MKIIVDGKEEMAYYLMLTKENAKAILNGSKKVELRSFSDYYVNLFINIDEFNKKIKNGDIFTVSETFKKDVKYIHFTNRQHSWFLDVEIESQNIGFLAEYDIIQLQEKYDFHELDPLIDDLNKKSEDELIDNFFYFVIKKVINSNL